MPARRLQPERGGGGAGGRWSQVAVVPHARRPGLRAAATSTRSPGPSVLSRGIVGDVGGRPVVASPMYKQHFAWTTAAVSRTPASPCATYPVRVVDERRRGGAGMTAVRARAGRGPAAGRVHRRRHRRPPRRRARRDAGAPRGAAVRARTAMRIVPLSDDTDLARDDTRPDRPTRPTIVVATTGIGFRGWVEAADGWGLGDALLAVLSARATLLARGPKARGAIRGAGLREAWSPRVRVVGRGAGVPAGRAASTGCGSRCSCTASRCPTSSSALRRGRRRRRRGAASTDGSRRRTCAAVDALIDAILAREVDTVTFTSAPAVEGLVAPRRGAGAARRGARRRCGRGRCWPAASGR